jgi:acyl-CoA dehydrogenase
VNIFKRQIGVFNEFMTEATPDEKQGEDLDFILNAGELFSLVVYGQLIIENTKIYKISDYLLDQIFDFMVRDFSRYALQMYSKQSTTEKQQEILMRMIMKPQVDRERYEAIIKEVYSLNGRYEMRR